MTNTNNTDTAATIDNVQIFWDSNGSTGWWLRYFRNGDEDGCSIEGDEDATIEHLAAQVAAELSDYGAADVKAYRAGREQPFARIAVDAGAVVSWRAV